MAENYREKIINKTSAFVKNESASKTQNSQMHNSLNGNSKYLESLIVSKKVNYEVNQQKRQAKHIAEIAQCTFQPQTNCLPSNVAFPTTLYNQINNLQSAFQQWQQEEQEAQTASELKRCTFHPNINKSQASYNRVHRNSNSVPQQSFVAKNDVKKAVARMRNAFEFKVDKSRLLERDYEWKDRKSMKQTQEKSIEDNNEKIPGVICFVQVNLPQGSQKIIVREGDDLELLAANFSEQFKLDPEMQVQLIQFLQQTVQQALEQCENN